MRALADAYRREGGARLGPERDQIINWYFESRRARLARDRKAELPAPDREALDWVESETGRLLEERPWLGLIGMDRLAARDPEAPAPPDRKEVGPASEAIKETVFALDATLGDLERKARRAPRQSPTPPPPLPEDGGPGDGEEPGV